MNNIGKLFIIAAPSGTGKTSLVSAVVSVMQHIKISISFTTRLPRVGEEDGQDYHFINEAEFQAMIANQQFLEYAMVYGHCYGTAKKWVFNEMKQGIDIILEIDWQGARQIKKLFPAARSIFILPPSLPELQARLHRRKQDNLEIIMARMEKAREEMSHYTEFDYLIINDKFELAREDLSRIIYSERLHCDIQQRKYTALLAELLQKR